MIVLSIYLLIFYVQAKTFAEFLIVGVKYKKPTNKAKKHEIFQKEHNKKIKKKLQQMGSLKTTKYMIINKFNKLQNKQFTYTKNRLNTYTLLNLHTRHREYLCEI